jgi:hypothetical protein
MEVPLEDRLRLGANLYWQFPPNIPLQFGFMGADFPI